MISEKRQRMIRDRLWIMKKAASEILDLTNERLIREDGVPYTDCKGDCDHCLIEKLCMQIVDIYEMNPESP